MKKQKKSRIMAVVALGVFGVLLLLAVFGLSRTVESIETEVIAHEPEAILASAGVTEGADVSLPVAYFDQRADACVNMYDMTSAKKIETRQFEWTNCGYGNKQLEQGLVEYELSDEYLPVGVRGELLSNRGLADMGRWFENVEEKSKEYAGKLQLKYEVGETAEFSFESEEFYPLDEVQFSAEDAVNKDGHNHLWTMNLAVPFTVSTSGEESFEITADDDTFVFVGNELALDMGGIHEATTGRLEINRLGEVYNEVNGEGMAYSGIQVAKDEGAIIRIFHADRDSASSVFKVRLTGMKLNIVQTQLASGDESVQVAYDPGDPEYVGPLGESMVVRPDGTKSYMVIATVLSAAVVVCSVMIVATMKVLMKK